MPPRLPPPISPIARADLLQECNSGLPDRGIWRGRVVAGRQADAVGEGQAALIGMCFQRLALGGGHVSNRAAVDFQDIEAQVSHFIEDRVKILVPFVRPIGVINADFVHVFSLEVEQCLF